MQLLKVWVVIRTLKNVKMTLNVRINMFSVFPYQYIESVVFLEVMRRGELQVP